MRRNSLEEARPIGLFWSVALVQPLVFQGFPSCRTLGFQDQNGQKNSQFRAHSQEMEVGKENFEKLWKSKLWLWAVRPSFQAKDRLFFI